MEKTSIHVLEIKKQKEILNCLYKKLGKITYIYINKNADTGNYKNMSKELCTRIKNTKRIIKNLEAENVTEPISNAPTPTTNSEGYNLYKFCPKCQVGNNPDSKKCVYCGEKFES